MTEHKLHRISKKDEVGYFAPRNWEFWRAVIVCFCLITIVGHLLEIPWCLLMDRFFRIVSDDYAVWTDPWYHPYWVYGFGAVGITLIVEPLKEIIVMHRKTLWGALLETFVITVILSAATELIVGLLVNQPDAFGEYPYWDNSSLPGNIFGQAWIVNDIAIGLVAVVYVWVIFPLVCEGFSLLRPQVANAAFAIILIGFIACCIASYLELAMK